MAEKPLVATTFRKASKRRRRTGTKLAGKAVAQILPALEQGGVERGTIDIAEAILQEGGRAIVVSNGGNLVDRLVQAGAEHIELPVHSKNPLKVPWTRRQVAHALRTCAVDLVHVRSRAPAWIAIPAARRLGLPVVTTIHNRFATTIPLKRRYNSIMARGDRVIAISSYIEGLVLKQFPSVSDRLSVIPRGVDTDVFSPEQVASSRVIRMARLLNLPDDRPIVMLPSRPSGWKGADLLVEAVNLLRERDFMVALIGAADGSKGYKQGLASRIRSYRLDDKVRLCGGVDDMPAALILADVVAMPSKSPEPFGRVAIEAQAMGCPVVAFDHGGAVESIQHGVTGWLADPLDVASLADCLGKALDLGDKGRLDLSVKARKHIAEHFSAARMRSETIAIYADLLRGAG